VDQGHRPETHYVYVARCANGALYVGYTTHVERRVAAHIAGRGGRYTRANRPIALVAAWSFTSKGEALRAEYAPKRLPRERKLAMIQVRHFSRETTHARVLSQSGFFESFGVPKSLNS
jgi:putative endonuclease